MEEELYYYVNLVFKLVICFTNNKLFKEKNMGKYLRMSWTDQQYRIFMLIFLLQKDIPADLLQLKTDQELVSDSTRYLRDSSMKDFYLSNVYTSEYNKQ